MNLSTPKPRKMASPSNNEVVQPPLRQRDRRDVIENDWVPAIQSSAMHQAKPIRLAGPLRPMWYVDGVKNLMFKTLRPTRQTV